MLIRLYTSTEDGEQLRAIQARTGILNAGAAGDEKAWASIDHECSMNHYPSTNHVMRSRSGIMLCEVKLEHIKSTTNTKHHL